MQNVISCVRPLTKTVIACCLISAATICSPQTAPSDGAYKSSGVVVRQQETSSRLPAAEASRAQPATYEELGVGDQLLIDVSDIDEAKHLAARIASDGTLDLPLIGIVQAAGQSLPSLRELLASRYSKYVTNPRVSVEITSSQTRTVSVLGEVNNPSVQELTGNSTLLAAISKAGGIRPDAGPKVIVTRERKSGMLTVPGGTVSSEGDYSRVSLPLDELLAEKTPANNIVLRAGDVVTVPKGSVVYVIGDVHRSGGFPLRSSGKISLVEALSLAEGLTPNAKSREAKILRRTDGTSDKRTEIPVDISKILAGKQSDPELVADDILFVPSSTAKAGFKRAAEAVLQVTTGVLIYR